MPPRALAAVIVALTTRFPGRVAGVIREVPAASAGLQWVAHHEGLYLVLTEPRRVYI